MDLMNFLLEESTRGPRWGRIIAGGVTLVIGIVGFFIKKSREKQSAANEAVAANLAASRHARANQVNPVMPAPPQDDQQDL